MNSKTLLIIGSIWPEPNATAAGGRMQRLIGFFLNEGYQITFSSTASESDLSMDLQSMGIQKQTIQLNHNSFDEFISELLPDVVLFDRFQMEEQFGWRVAKFAPKAFRILDTEDLHSLRKTREKALKEKIRWTKEYWLQAAMTKREVASIYRSDLSLIISSFEMELLQETLHIDTALLLHLPFMLEPITPETSLSWPLFDKRTDFMFVGTGKHAPNVDAIKWLKTKIWPLIRKALPETNCHIYGSYLPKAIAQMHKPKEGFYVEGEISNAAEVMKNKRINLAPLRFGAGLKGKLIAGMLNGTPNVTTAIGAEGMHAELPWNGAIVDSAEDFASVAISLYTDYNKWIEAQNRGVALLNKNYNSATHQNNLRAKIKEITTNLPTHRTQNFIGALVQHQSMASTKYMSKWIAAKNNPQ